MDRSTFRNDTDDIVNAFEPYYGRLLNDPILSEHHHDMSLFLKDAIPAYEKSFVLITTNIEWKCFFNLRPQIPNAVVKGSPRSIRLSLGLRSPYRARGPAVNMR